jgi:hypothetical protein
MRFLTPSCRAFNLENLITLSSVAPLRLEEFHFQLLKAQRRHRKTIAPHAMRLRAPSCRAFNLETLSTLKLGRTATPGRISLPAFKSTKKAQKNLCRPNAMRFLAPSCRAFNLDTLSTLKLGRTATHWKNFTSSF